MEPTTQEIPKSNWVKFLKDLSAEYDGWGVWVELLLLDLGDQPIAQGVDLQEISLETKGSEAGNILIEAGERDDYMVHRVLRPQALRVSNWRPGAEVDLEIESEDGTITLIWLRRRRALPGGRATSLRELIQNRRERWRQLAPKST